MIAAVLVALGCTDPTGDEDAGARDAAAPDAASPDAMIAGDAGAGGPSDEFEGTALDAKWRVFRPEVADLRVGGGALAIEMTQGALWFEGQSSVLVYQEITGDFGVSSVVRARKTTSAADPPDRTVHLAGVMARHPSSATENYVFIVVGYDEVDLSVETKSTTNGSSAYVGPPWPSGDAELFVCRRGSRFSLYQRPIGGATWALAAEHDRPDLPATLQVGLIAYALGTPDLTASFDAIRFEACP